MSDRFDALMTETLQLQATRAKVVEVAKIKFSSQLRGMCAQNSCGNYGTNWMCPPAVGPIEELKAKAREYQYGLLFQLVCPLEDSFDVEGMAAGKKRLESIIRDVLALLREKPWIGALFPLGVGPCDICPKCAYLTGEACRFPEMALSSVEAYGIDVLHLVSTNGMPYNNGEATVSYVGLVLFNESTS